MSDSLLDQDGPIAQLNDGLRAFGQSEIYKQNGLDYFRPWMFLITGGQ